MHCLFLELATGFLLLRLKDSLDNTIPSVHCALVGGCVSEVQSLISKSRLLWFVVYFAQLNLPLRKRKEMWLLFEIHRKKTVTRLFIYIFLFWHFKCSDSLLSLVHQLPAVFCCKCPDWCNPRRTEVHASSVVWVGHIWVTGSHRWLTASVSNSGGADLCLPFEFL